MAEQDSGATAPDIFAMNPMAEVEVNSLVPQGQAEPSREAGPAEDQTATEATADEDAYEAEKPDDLPPELEQRWEEERKKHMRNYQRQLHRVREQQKGVDAYRQKAEMVDRFYSDPQFAAQTMQQMAQQLGYTLTRTTGQPPQRGAGSTPAVTTNQDGQMPEYVRQAAEAAFADSPDLKFLAPTIAQVAWSISQASTEPLHKELQDRRTQDEHRRQQERQSEFERMAQHLEEQGVDWREHEDEMTDRLEFLRQAINGGPQTHPKFGSMLQLLYDWTAGPRRAQAEAGRRLRTAVTNRTSAGTASRSAGVNTEQLIREAKSDREKWAIAFQAARAELPTQFNRG